MEPDGDNTTLERVTAILSKICAADKESINQSGYLRGYGVDSIRAIELMVSIQEEFGVELTLVDVQHVKTVGDLVDYVTRLRVAKEHSQTES